MPAEFDLYMKSKDIYTAKNGEAQQYYVFYMELKTEFLQLSDYWEESFNTGKCEGYCT